MRQRVLDAGCGTGAMTEELARRGAQVTAIDISPQLVDIAKKRIPEALHDQIEFTSGDMLSPDLGAFDHVMAMDSMIYYTDDDLGQALAGLSARVSSSIVFTVAPRTPFLMAFFTVGKLFPRSDRSPTMIPQLAHADLVSSRRDGRSLFYSANYGRFEDLLRFLTEKCCTGGAARSNPRTPKAATAARR